MSELSPWSHPRLCVCAACSIRRETKLRAQLERLTDRIATQAEIIGVWSELIDSMESELATLRALAAGRTEYLRGFDDGVYSAKKEYGISDAECPECGRDPHDVACPLAGDAPHACADIGPDGNAVRCPRCALAGDAPKEQP